LLQDAEYGPPGALLDAGLAHEHDCVLRGADLDEELPSDLLDSALLDDGHATPWARAGLVLHEDLAPGGGQQQASMQQIQRSCVMT